MARFDQDKVELWRGIIDRQQDSQVSAMRFCREAAIPYWKFNYWKKRLAKIDGVVGHVESEVDSEEQQIGFAEVCLVDGALGEEQSSGSPLAEVELPGGVTIRLYRQIDIKLLPGLIREVTGS